MFSLGILSFCTFLHRFAGRNKVVGWVFRKGKWSLRISMVLSLWKLPCLHFSKCEHGIRLRCVHWCARQWRNLQYPSAPRVVHMAHYSPRPQLRRCSQCTCASTVSLPVGACCQRSITEITTVSKIPYSQRNFQQASYDWSALWGI